MSRSRVRALLSGLGLLAVLTPVTSAFAYEEDSHFLMTYVVCRSAGLTEAEARIVAAVDQGMDDSPGTVANGGTGGVIPNVTEEWLWHALDRLGNMGPSEVLRRKDHLFQLAMTRDDLNTRLLFLGVFYHYQQDVWAHRHHYDGEPHSYNAYTTYNTPFGHARHGHQPDRPPFDPVAAYLDLVDGIAYAQIFVAHGLGREPNALFMNAIPPLAVASAPGPGVFQDDNWDDKRKGAYFHMLGSQGGTPQQSFLAELIQAQVGGYSSSLDANPNFAGHYTPDQANFAAVRSAIEAVCQRHAGEFGYESFTVPTWEDKQKTQLEFGAAMGISSIFSMTTANLATSVDFVGNAGQNSSATSEIGLQVNESVRINGQRDLSSAIQANDGGRVYGIKLVSSPGIYDYVLVVDAQGPKGFGSGNMYLNFTDETGDVYALKVFDSSRKTHSLSYSSKKPTIMKIRWSNRGNLVTGQID